MAALVSEHLSPLLQHFRVPLNDLIDLMDQAFDYDRRFDSLSTPFEDLTGYQDAQIWEWLFPEGTVDLP